MAAEDRRRSAEVSVLEGMVDLLTNYHPVIFGERTRRTRGKVSGTSGTLLVSSAGVWSQETCQPPSLVTWSLKLGSDGMMLPDFSGRRIAILTGALLAWNPRALKEASAIAQCGAERNSDWIQRLC